MKKLLRLLVVACAGFAAMAFAAPALAAYTPSLTIEQSTYKPGAGTTVAIVIGAAATDDPTAKLTLISPAGYGVNLNQAAGTKLGSAVAIVQANALAGARLVLSGDVVVGNPADATIAATSVRCTGSPVNQAVLVLNLSVPGQTQTVPFLVFVNKVGAVATFQACAPHPDDAPFGIRILALVATIRGVFTNPTASNGYEWSTIFTPYASTKTPNPAGTIEWRTYAGIPSSLSFKRVKSSSGLKFSGALHVTGLNPKGVRLRLYYSKKPNPASNPSAKFVRTAALPASGKYTIKRPNVKVRTYFQVRFENYVTNCDPPSPAPQGCKGEDIAALTSSQIRVSPPRKRR